MNNQEKKEDAGCSATCCRRKFRVLQRHHALHVLPFNCVVLHSEGEKPKGHCGPSHQIIALVIAYPELSTSGIQAQSL